MYQDEIKKYSPLTIENIINTAVMDIPQHFRVLPFKYRDAEGRTLERGTAVLETEEQCSAYIAAYGRMHSHKLYYALDKAQDKGNFPYEAVHNGVEIYDWGCGQGIGTLAVIENLRKQGLLSCLKKVTLEEPSDVARNRAVLHVEQALGSGYHVFIEDYSEYLPSDSLLTNAIKSIEVEQLCAIHIFSNILDIESVSLKGVSKLITSSGSRHIVLCIGPANLNESRINSFKNYFKENNIEVFTDFSQTKFGKHPNGKDYGCLIKSFTFSLTSPESVLHKYKYFAPMQMFACFAGTMPKHRTEKDGAFEVMAPFDMTVRKDLNPVFALISNLISRGIPTFASENVISALLPLTTEKQEKSFKAIARIQKTIVEAMITSRLSILTKDWKILLIEDGTDVAEIAVQDFSEMYHHLIAMTETYNTWILPHISMVKASYANVDDTFDIAIDVSVDKYAEPENVVFSKYKVRKDCYFIVRSSRTVFEPRILYTTERIRYKSFVEKDLSGKYIVNKETTSHLRYFLNLIFKKEDFRPGQLPILTRALSLKSVIGLLPTGGGKSLTYQLAAILQPAVTLVVDPLKGLMKDQYDGLLSTGIDCISYINSDVEDKHVREQSLTQSRILIMFLSPERLSIHRFRETLRSMRESDVFFAYGVIDEVHCVSEWGHDFRLAYLHLGRNLYNYVLPKEIEGEENHISLFGLTATASFDVLADVERELSGPNSYTLEDDATIRYENTNRLELQYVVIPIDAEEAQNTWDVGTIKENLLLDVINEVSFKINEIQTQESIRKIRKRFIDRENITDIDQIETINATDLNVSVDRQWYSTPQSDSAGIVFCLRANSQSTLSPNSAATKLKEHGITRLSTYKGGDNSTNQDLFLSGQTNLMIATKAFGMGIDKSNVRITVHLNYPGSLESFVQEAGRSGRDKRMALAAIMYSPKKFWQKNVRTGEWIELSSDYMNNKFFYDKNFLGEEFELFVMSLLMNNLIVKISNEEMLDISESKVIETTGILKFIKKYNAGTVLTYYINYEEDEAVLDCYNKALQNKNMPLFDTLNSKHVKNDKGFSYTRNFGSSQYKDAIQKAIYRMCVIGLIDDFTEDYYHHNFRITTVCQDETKYLESLKLYYRKYYSEERANNMISEVRNMAEKDGVILACLKHLTAFIYRSIAEKRARGILDMEQFCNSAISSGDDWKEVNENLKDFIYYYFNSKYAREGFVTYDSSVGKDIPYSLKDDTDSDRHSENEITNFNLVKKYLRIVDPEIVNNDSQKDNVKHLQGAIRLIRRAAPEMNPVLNLLNIFCILFLGQQNNEMLEEEIINDYDKVLEQYTKEEKTYLLDEFTNLLEAHGALQGEGKDYFQKLRSLITLDQHVYEFKNISRKYLAQ